MPPDDEPLLSVADLKVAIDGKVILEKVSFTVSRGEVLTILGPNGSGKTVLLRALLGVLPYRGSIRWRRGTGLGYVPQRLPYIRDLPLSVADFFALKRGTRAEARALLHAVGLGEQFARAPMGHLSSGQFQRILIAWALAGDPDVLLFDEPTTGIDLGGEETVYSLLGRLNRERNLAMLIVTHDLAVVHKLSSTVLCLNRQPICIGPPITTLTPENLARLFGTEVTFYQHRHEAASPGA